MDQTDHELAKLYSDTTTVGMCGIVVLFWFGLKKKNLDSVWKEFCSVWKTRFSSNTVVTGIYYVCSTWVVNLQQILQVHLRDVRNSNFILVKLGFGRVLKRSLSAH